MNFTLNVQISAPAGTYSICRSIQRLAIDYGMFDGNMPDIPVSCAVPGEEDMCTRRFGFLGMVLNK